MKRDNAGVNPGSGNRVFATCLTAALAFVLVWSLPAVAEVSYDSSINYYKDGAYQSIESDDSADSHIHYQSFSGGVGSGWSVTNGESFGITTAHADAADLSMGVKAQIYSTPANNHLSDASVFVEVSNRLTILPGRSGLQNGDSVTLTIKMRTDGSLHGEATSWPSKGWSHSEIDAGLSVYDQAIQIDTGEGFITPRQAFFGAFGELEAYDVSKPHWQHSYSGSWSESWRYGSNISETVSHNNSWETEETSESFHYQADHLLDTGELTLVFEAIVGHTLDFEADMSIYIDACNDAQTWANFDNTFAFDVISNVDGLNLNWGTVPEPASLSLLAVGAAMLRRRKA